MFLAPTYMRQKYYNVVFPQLRVERNYVLVDSCQNHAFVQTESGVMTADKFKSIGHSCFFHKGHMYTICPGNISLRSEELNGDRQILLRSMLS